ncbi:MAG: sulfite exporter TauE/SafE family protein [Candidatus Margulisiibacteriota bacterium]
MPAQLLGAIILTGFGAGLLSGLMGVGGGTITIPALVFLLGISQHSAQGISLAIIIPTAIMGAYGYFMKGYVDVNRVVFISCGAVAGALLGSFSACRISSCNLKQIFGVFVIIIAIKVIADVFSRKK